MDQRRLGRSLPASANESADSVLAGFGPSTDTLEAVSEGESRTRAVENALRRLSEPLRVAIVLRYMEDLQYGEIADVLGCSVGTVKSRLSRAHHFLQDVLKPNAERERE
jgi:RNA polymerase sigma-70 factor (ECF subfamily)